MKSNYFLVIIILFFLGCEKNMIEKNKNYKETFHEIDTVKSKEKILFKLDNIVKILSKKNVLDTKKEELLLDTLNFKISNCTDYPYGSMKKGNFTIETNKFEIVFKSVEKGDNILDYELVNYFDKLKLYVIYIETIDNIKTLLLFKDGTYFIGDGEIHINKDGRFILFGNTVDNSFLKSYIIRENSIVNLKNFYTSEISISDICESTNQTLIITSVIYDKTKKFVIHGLWD